MILRFPIAATAILPGRRFRFTGFLIFITGLARCGFLTLSKIHFMLSVSLELIVFSCIPDFFLEFVPVFILKQPQTNPI